MRLMDRRLIFLAIAVTAWAQQPSPEAATAEAALRARAQQFFDLQVAKKYRPAEDMVAEDSKDEYYNGNRYNIKGFSIQNVEMLDENSRAKVTIKAKTTLIAPGVPSIDLDVSLTSSWKLEDDRWVWYVDQSGVANTPFGKISTAPNGGPPPSITPGNLPDLSALRQSVKADKTSVTISLSEPVQTVTISNELPGPVDLVELDSDKVAGFSSQLDKKHLETGEKTTLRVTLVGEAKGKGIIHVLASPIGTQLDIAVTVN
jgi:hypothetical protein